MLTKGPKLNTTAMMTMQYPVGIKPQMLAKVDYVFLFKVDTPTILKRLYTQYAGVVPNFKLFADMIRTGTRDYQCLVIDRNSLSPNLSDKIFWYKAKKRYFRFGSDELYECEYGNGPKLDIFASDLRVETQEE